MQIPSEKHTSKVYFFKKTTELSLVKTFFSPINLTWHPEREFRGAAHHPKLSLAKTTCGAASPHSAYTVSFLESGPLYNPPWTTLGPVGFFKHATGQDFLAISQNRDWREKKRLFFSSLPLSVNTDRNKDTCRRMRVEILERMPVRSRISIMTDGPSSKLMAHFPSTDRQTDI